MLTAIAGRLARLSATRPAAIHRQGAGYARASEARRAWESGSDAFDMRSRLLAGIAAS
jgi:hypothetical protein